MHFGIIEDYLLFGGGALLAQFALELKKKGKLFGVVTSERHAKEHITSPAGISLEAFLAKEAVKLIISSDINSDRKVLSAISSKTLGVSIGAAWVFKPSFIDRFNGKLVNLHGSRLPRDRGGGGFSWRILRNDRLGCSLIHLVDKGIDTGKIVAFEEYSFPPSCHIPLDYHAYSIDQYLSLLRTFINDIDKDKEFKLLSQPEYLSTYWPRLSTDHHAYIDWSWKLKEIEQFICAFDNPYNGAITFLNGKRIRLKNCISTSSDGTFHSFQQGLVYRLTANGVFVACRGGSLIIQDIRDYNNLSKVDQIGLGDRFYTPYEFLEQARQYRAVYTTTGLKGHHVKSI